MSWKNPPIILYHATTQQHVESLKGGVRHDVGKSLTDFGTGFYTTTNFEQAKIWANRKSNDDRSGGSETGTKPVILEYSVSRDALAELDILAFVRGDKDASDYWALVKFCRKSVRNHNRKGDSRYDICFGPIATNWWDDGSERVKKDSDQISFHTEKAVALLKNPVVREI